MCFADGHISSLEFPWPLGSSHAEEEDYKPVDLYSDLVAADGCFMAEVQVFNRMHGYQPQTTSLEFPSLLLKMQST